MEMIPYAIGFLVVEYAAFFAYLKKDYLSMVIGNMKIHGKSDDLKNLKDAEGLLSSLSNEVAGLKVKGKDTKDVEKQLESLDALKGEAYAMIAKKDSLAKKKIDEIIDGILEVQEKIEKL